MNEELVEKREMLGDVNEELIVMYIKKINFNYFVFRKANNTILESDKKSLSSQILQKQNIIESLQSRILNLVIIHKKRV